MQPLVNFSLDEFKMMESGKKLCCRIHRLARKHKRRGLSMTERMEAFGLIEQAEEMLAMIEGNPVLSYARDVLPPYIEVLKAAIAR